MGCVMNKPSFFEGVLIALIASLAGSAGYFALSFIFSEESAVKLIVAGLTLAYLLYLFSRSRIKTGRFILITAWCFCMLALWLINPSLTLFIICQGLAIWLIRSWFFSSTLLSSLADFGLTAFSLATAFWACAQTGSLFLTLWCFFLIQALFAHITSGGKASKAAKTGVRIYPDDFRRAYQNAEAAVRKLSSR